MSMIRRSGLLVLWTAALSLASCKQPVSTEGAPPPSLSAAAAQSPKAGASPSSFGDPITSKETVLLADLARDPGAWSGKTVVISGIVTSVCQNMGCWMVIEDQGAQSMVRMKNHAFGVPKDSKGKRVRVQGQVNSSAANGPKHDCPHGGHGEQSDSGAHHECQKATAEQVPFEASGVEFI